jgi:hypothetical protein
MSCKKRLGYCDVGIGWFLQHMPFVRIDDVHHRNIFGVPRGNNRIFPSLCNATSKTVWCNYEGIYAGPLMNRGVHDLFFGRRGSVELGHDAP